MFRLVPGQSVTIGRAPTNQIVIKDERCSRNHAEVFMSGGQWTLRDLDSRNGTMVGDQLVTRRLAAEARRRHSHRPFATGLRPRACPRRLPTSSDASAAGRAGEPPATRGRRRRRFQRAGGVRADDDHASPRADASSSRRARRKTTRRLEDGPGGGQALPAGVRAGQGARRGRDGRAGAGAACSKERRPTPARCCCCRASYQGEPRGDDLEVVASRSASRAPLSSRLATSWPRP